MCVFCRKAEAFYKNPDGIAGIIPMFKIELEPSALGNILFSHLTNRSMPQKISSALRTDDQINLE